MTSLLMIVLVLGIVTVSAYIVIDFINFSDEKERENERFDNQNEQQLKEEIKYYSPLGDPLLISEDEVKMEMTPLFPEHYFEHDIVGDYWYDLLFYFDYNCDGKNQMGDRNPVGTLTLYIDYNKDERITNGCEAMWSYSTPAHVILSEKDSNRDGIIDSQDSIWPKVRMTDWDESWTPEELGYEYFDLTGYVTLQHDDCHNFIGTYANGEIGYVKDKKYYECIEQGWSPIEPITNNHLRVVGYNDCGGYQKEQGCVRIYSGVLGYWEKVQ